jgi:single-stranded-DNA-specific exonuclease
MIRRLIPRLNASGRLGDVSAVWHLLHSDDAGALDEWMAATASAHATTKELHRQVLGEAQEQINRLHFRDQYVMVVSRAGWPQGLMGPLASQISERYGRPAIAIAFDEHEGVGSGRSAPRFDLLNALKECQQFLVRFGGHAQACGLTLQPKHLEAFKSLVNTHAQQQLGCDGLIQVRWLDMDLPLEALQLRWVEEIVSCAPFGRGNPRPTVAIRRLAIQADSPRTGWVSDGVRRVRVKGTLPPLLEAGTRYDVAAVPAAVDGVVGLTLLDAKASTGPL